MKDSKLIVRGILSAVGVAVYVFLLSLFLNNGSKIFGEVDNELIAPVLFLLTFVFSALVTSSLVLAKPIMLFLEGAKKEAVKLLFYTGASLFILVLITAIVLYIFRQ